MDENITLREALEIIKDMAKDSHAGKSVVSFEQSDGSYIEFVYWSRKPAGK